jgi:hypothetical protein
MAIIDLDGVPSSRRRRGDPALIVALACATAVFALAMWASAPHPTTPAATIPTAVPSVAVSSAISAGPILITALSVTGDPVSSSAGGGLGSPGVWAPGARTLVLPPWANGVDLFEVPDRLTNENLLWTLRNVVHIRGGTGLASAEGPSVITWTENGFQYWMVSPTQSTDQLVEIADGLR